MIRYGLNQFIKHIRNRLTSVIFTFCMIELSNFIYCIFRNNRDF